MRGGAAKPDPAIFEIALDRLGVAAEDALFVDDQQAFCDAAAALGIRAVLIDRVAGTGEVSTLADLADVLLSRPSTASASRAASCRKKRLSSRPVSFSTHAT